MKSPGWRPPGSGSPVYSVISSQSLSTMNTPVQMDRPFLSTSPLKLAETFRVPQVTSFWLEASLVGSQPFMNSSKRFTW